MALSQIQQVGSQRKLAPTLFDIPEDTFQASPKENIVYIKTPTLKQVVTKHHENIENALKAIFLDSKEESRLQLARRILGDIALEITDEELLRCITEFQYLADSWLDDFEKQIFDDKTLNQVLKEGQNGSTYSR